MIDVTRSQPPPASLADESGWTGDDVRERLHEDFLGKCYLCEGHLPRGWQVDHRHPRNAGGASYAWSNLFPICSICNQRRPRTWPEAGRLDPAGDEDVHGRLLQQLRVGVGPSDTRILFEAKDPADLRAVNTVEELHHIHGAHHTDALTLRGRILARWARLQTCWIQYRQEPTALHRAEVRTFLVDDAPYAALMRSRLLELVGAERMAALSN